MPSVSVENSWNRVTIRHYKGSRKDYVRDLGDTKWVDVRIRAPDFLALELCRFLSVTLLSS